MCCRLAAMRAPILVRLVSGLIPKQKTVAITSTVRKFAAIWQSEATLVCGPDANTESPTNVVNDYGILIVNSEV